MQEKEREFLRRRKGGRKRTVVCTEERSPIKKGISVQQIIEKYDVRGMYEEQEEEEEKGH